MWKAVISLFVMVTLMVFETQAQTIKANGSHDVDDLDGKSPAASAMPEISQKMIPDHFEVRPNYPNPFNATTTIEYDLPVDAGVYAIVYNILGHQIRTLKNEIQEPGKYSLQWDGTTNGGHEAASGVYFYVLLADDNYSIGKMLLLK